ncbi:peptidase S66 family protein [Oscillibacter valericigenes Sjm18-20]|nr:peptidase S66 family protein [Oscillibacter valericigenes Sjm18-20]
MVIRPPMLRAGDTFGIVTLGSPLDPAEIDERISFLKEHGFHVVLGDYVYASNGYLAGTDQQRASDLMRMYKNPEVKAILPTRGGVGVEGILPYLDYGYIASHPKIISGYSDITILLNVLYQLTNQITFHSLLLLDFRDSTPEYNFAQYFSTTSSTLAPRQIVNPPDMPMISRVPGNVTGSLVGGNLTSFVGSLGTPYEISTKGKIILLEETHEPINTVYRYLNQLKIAGKFEDCIGIIIGECTNCTDEYGKSYEDLITEFIVPLGKPLLTNIASGHGKYKAALPIGAVVNLNTIKSTLTILRPTVCSDDRLMPSAPIEI